MGFWNVASIPVNAPRWSRTWTLWPQILWFVVFFAVPIGFIAVASVFGQSKHLTMAHYTAFVSDSYDRQVIVRTLFIGVATTILALVLSYPVARGMARGSALTRWILGGLVFFPLLTSSVVRSFGWLVLLADNGLLNNALHLLGLPAVHLIFNSCGIVIALAQVLLPFMVLSLTNAMANIDPAIEDAARTLGSSAARRFVRVTLPLLVPGILSGSLLVFAIAISSFVTPALVGGPRAAVMATLIYTSATQLGNLGLASAASIILLLLTFAIVTLYYRVSSRPSPEQAES